MQRKLYCILKGEFTDLSAAIEKFFYSGNIAYPTKQGKIIRKFVYI